MHATRLFTVLLVSFFVSATASSLAAQTITHVPLYTFEGRSVSGAGDANGDGRADLIVEGGDTGLNIARVLSGIDGSVLLTLAGAPLGGDGFGGSISGTGDVNGDGFADLIIGAEEDDTIGRRSGSARVFSGSDGSVLYTFYGDSEFDQFGSSVSGAGDANGDGIPDMIVGATDDGNNGSRSGSARVLSGNDGSVLHNFDGDSASDRFGWSVSGAGDVNGDGFADLIVGAPSDDNNGNNSGSARVLSGSDGSELYTFDGDSEHDLFGRSVSGAGDVNGDGFADLIVGAPNDANNGYSSGSVRVFSGSDGNVLYTFDGDEGDSMGWSVSSAGDVNGDGTPDLIVGAPGDDNNGSGSGSARVLSGSDGSVLYTFHGDGGFDQFGSSVSGAGDVNGDGIDDFIVGADKGGGGNDIGYARVFVSQFSPPICLLGDVDLSGSVAFADIPAFIEILIGGTNQCEADCDQSGVVDFADIPAFIEILLAS